MFQATLFQTLPLQQTEAQVTSASSEQNSQAVTDVIQQLLGLSEPGPGEPSQAPQPGQQLSIAVGVSQDILQVRPAYLLSSVCVRNWASLLKNKYAELVKVEESALKMCPKLKQNMLI